MHSKLNGRDINNQRVLEEVAGEDSWMDARSNIKVFSNHSDDSFDTWEEVEEARKAGTLETVVYDHWKDL